MPAARVLQRELRVAFSRRAQPVWFRVAKWLLFTGVGASLWRTPYFWWVAGGGLLLGSTAHAIWRWKTKGWTQPWYGWNDVDTANKD